jgi:hypothetical protein
MKAVVESSQARTEGVVAVGSKERALLTEADEVVAQFEDYFDDIVGWEALGGLLNDVWSDCRTEWRKKVDSGGWKHCEQPAQYVRS